MVSHGQVRVSAATVCAVLLILFSAFPGMAETPDAPQDSLDDIVRSLGIASSPVDYVVIVDTSRSMQDSGLYPKVKSALESFLRGLRPIDHLSLLTFDTTATLRYTGAVGSDPRSSLNQLSPIAAGQSTDIGAGIEAGIAELERPNANTIGAIVLMTDGKIQAPSGSAYPAPSAPAWDALQERARKITAKHQVASYALALDPTTDAALLKKLFPEALVVALPSDQIEGYLGRVSSNSIRQKVIQALQPDLTDRASVNMSGKIDDLDQSTGTANVTITLNSPYSTIPVIINNLFVSVTGDLQATASTPPSSITIKQPEKTVSFRLRLTFPTTGLSGLAEHFFTHHDKIVLTGNIFSPWQQAITSDLGLAFTPRLENTPVNITVPGVTGFSLEALLLTFAFAIIIVLLILTVRYSRIPHLVGVLELWHEGKLVSDITLGGRVLKLGKGSRSVPGRPLSGSVRGLRRHDYDGEEAGVSIHAKLNRARVQEKLFDGDSVQVNDVKIIYRRP